MDTFDCLELKETLNGPVAVLSKMQPMGFNNPIKDIQYCILDCDGET